MTTSTAEAGPPGRVRPRRSGLRREFLVRWGVATLTGWVVLVPLYFVFDRWPYALQAGMCMAVASLLLATYLPGAARATGAWAALMLPLMLPFENTPEYWDGALFAGSILTIPIVAWFSLAAVSIGALRLTGVLPRRQRYADPAPASATRATVGP